MVNKTQKKYTWLSLSIIAGVLIIDQVSKILVKTNMFLGEEINVFSWFKILFIENNGMAFGLELGSKLFLTLFRIFAIILIGYYIFKLIKENNNVKKGYIACLSLIFAGALGNIIDCMFYGVIFNSPAYPMTATIFPADGGYAELRCGCSDLLQV